jgi:hypothetical protein
MLYYNRTGSTGYARLERARNLSLGNTRTKESRGYAILKEG